MKTIALLGDSIIDNGIYTGDAPCVEEILAANLGKDWQVVRLAVDGHMIRNVYQQLKSLPPSTTHIILSVGGNDALMHSQLLMPGSSRTELLDLAKVAEGFAADYANILREVKKRNLPLAVCTIYEGSFPDKDMQRKAIAAVAVFNDKIIRAAMREGIPVIELRETCNKPEYFTDQIEPSAAGGKQIAKAFQNILLNHDFRQAGTRLYS